MKKLILLILLCSSMLVAQGSVSRAEYYIDADPGYGSATAISVTPGTDITLNFTADLSSLPDGIHVLYVRAMNDSGWSLPYSQVFLKEPNTPLSSVPNIVAAEYYMDTDPGNGLGTAIAVTSGSDRTESFLVDLTGLNDGLHVLYVRGVDANGQWSQTYSKPFLKESSATTDPLPDIVSAEYYVDSDPGYGNATAISVTPGTDVISNFVADLSGLTNGLHVIYLRGVDASGNWSVVYSKPFVKDATGVTEPTSNLASAEYFFDTDPGFSQGAPITVAGTTNDTSSFTADMSALNPGIHIFYTRARAANGLWSLTTARPVLVEARGTIDALPNMITAEYFVDFDPGFGMGTRLSLTAGTDVIRSFSATLDTQRAGIHILYVRGQDSDGNWSQAFSRPFLAEAAGSGDTPADISSVEYYLRQGGVNSTPMSVIDFAQGADVTVEFCAKLMGLMQDSTYELHMTAQDAGGNKSVDYVHQFVVDSSAVILNKAPNVLMSLPTVNPNEDFDSIFVADLTTVFSDSNIKLCGDSLRFSVTISNAIVTVSLNGSLLTLYGIANANGLTTVVMTATDDSGATAVDSFTVDVASVNDMPIASDDAITVLAGPTVTLTVLRNDTDVDGDVLSIMSLLSGPANGSALINTGDSTINYTATVTYSGPDQITYVVSDGQGGSDTATVNITVTPARALTLSTSVLQNPALSKYADLYVVADTNLQSSPQVKLFLGNDSSSVSMTQQSGNPRIYKGAIEFTVNGTYTIRTYGLSVNGLSSTESRSFNASLAKPGLAFVLTSTDGSGRLALERKALSKETFFLAQQRNDHDETVYQFGPLVDLAEPAEINLLFEEVTWTDPSKLFVYRFDGGVWKQLRSQVYLSDRRVRALSPTLGQFKIGYDPTFSGSNVVPETFALHQNYPNPFNPSTTITYDLAEDADLKLAVYNLLGQQVKVLKSGQQLAGSYKVVWDGKNERGETVASGIYFYRMVTRSFVRTQKMILLK
ncbi:MAG: cadherin-like domain-containing protein [Bacteroidetes bacterium]|nr:cadherin-like domain-containing protein [Bacteroidota bacterium]